MLVIVKGRPIEIDWYIFKGANKQAEDFSQLDAGSIKVFLVGPSNKGDDQISRFNRFTYAVNVATDDNNKQYLKIDIDDTASALLDTGIYDIKVVWVKNSELHLGIREGNQHLSESRLSGIFAITADSSEDNTRLDSGVTAKKILRSFVEPTGYDGLSAYEIAVMHGYTEDEQTWSEEYTQAEDRTDYEMDETKAGDGSTTRDDEKHVPVEEWVHESWAHKVEVTWQNNETTRQSQESTRQSNETTRKNNEGIGATDAECAAGSRRKNESIRVSNESTRQSQEGTRQDNETTRGQKETARQKAEGQLGTTDPDYATSRVKKELDRQSAESTRISNEEGRVAAEGSVEGQTGRAYAESVRVSNESTRQSNEGSRGSAETARQKAEGQLGNTDPDYATSRIKQELDRQSAEAARELAETARENAKISSTTIEYAVGDSGTTPPSSGWQSSIPSYTTGDFLWGRTTMTFGDGTSKVLYAIGSVPDVAVSQNASTGKTTITVGSDSYDVATEPVSVSQNSQTGGYDVKVGSNTYNVASQADVSALIDEVNPIVECEVQLGSYTPDGWSSSGVNFGFIDLSDVFELIYKVYHSSQYYHIAFFTDKDITTFVYGEVLSGSTISEFSLNKNDINAILEEYPTVRYVLVSSYTYNANVYCRYKQNQIKKINEKVDKSDIENSLTSTNPNKVLGAEQGKVLGDRLNNIESYFEKAFSVISLEENWQKLDGCSCNINGEHDMIILSPMEDYVSYALKTTKDIVLSAEVLGNLYYAMTFGSEGGDIPSFDGSTTQYVAANNATRLRAQDSNLPTENSPLTLVAGSVIFITVRVVDVNRYVSEYTEKGNLKSDYISIDVETSTKYNINLGKYQLDLIYSKDTSINYEGWNLLRLRSGSIQITNGDILGVIKESDEDDFMGGVHGDEKNVGLLIKCDGIDWDRANTRVCKVITIDMLSEIYRVSSKEHIYDRLIHLELSRDYVRISNTYKCITNTSVVEAAYNGGLIDCPQGICTGVIMNNYYSNTAPTTQPSNASKDNVEGTIYWYNGVITIRNIKGHELDTYKGYDWYYATGIQRQKIYLGLVHGETKTLQSGDLLCGICEYVLR